MGSPKKSPEEGKAEKTSPTKDNDKAAAIMKDESIELVDQSDEDIKYKEEEQEKDKQKPKDEKFKISQRFSEVGLIEKNVLLRKHLELKHNKMYKKQILQDNRTLLEY